MGKRISIKHDAEGSGHALTWRVVSLDGKPTVKMTCANRHAAFLVDHGIGEGGDVSPSVDCPECDFHDFVTLDGWQEHGAAAIEADPTQELAELGDSMPDDEPEGGGSIRA